MEEKSDSQRQRSLQSGSYSSLVSSSLSFSLFSSPLDSSFSQSSSTQKSDDLIVSFCQGDSVPEKEGESE